MPRTDMHKYMRTVVDGRERVVPMLSFKDGKPRDQMTYRFALESAIYQAKLLRRNPNAAD